MDWGGICAPIEGPPAKPPLIGSVAPYSDAVGAVGIGL